jgi:hypothetical protein
MKMSDQFQVPVDLPRRKQLVMVNWKGFGRKLSWPNFWYYPVIRLDGLRKTTKNLNQDSLPPGPRFEPGTSRIRSRSVNHSTTTFGKYRYSGEKKY